MKRFMNLFRAIASSWRHDAQERASRRAFQDVPIIPEASVPSQSLSLVIAIMTFLASIAAGCIQLIISQSIEWKHAISREVTIQILPSPNIDLTADLKRAAEIISTLPGVADFRIYPQKESEALLTPWLGENFSLGDVLIPRLIAIRLTPEESTLKRLKEALSVLSSAKVDDRRVWLSQLSLVSNSLATAGAVIFFLIMIAMGLAIVFATRGAMAENREIINILHLIGAHDHFIAREFQQAFFKFGLKGGMIGGILAIALFEAIHLVLSLWSADMQKYQFEIIFGAFELSWHSYAAIVVIVSLVSFIASLVSRSTVFKNISRFE